jgi:hypothetical protein
MAQKEIKFACPHCGRKGEVIWGGAGSDRVLLRLSNEFHIEEGRLPGTRHVIICNACDEIDPPRLVKL